jgi:hypothetical protein
MNAKTYEIRVRGRLPDDLVQELEYVTGRVEPIQTLLQGRIPDQPALYGILDRLQSVGIELIEIRQVADAPEDG